MKPNKIQTILYNIIVGTVGVQCVILTTWSFMIFVGIPAIVLVFPWVIIYSVSRELKWLKTYRTSSKVGHVLVKVLLNDILRVWYSMTKWLHVPTERYGEWEIVGDWFIEFIMEVGIPIEWYSSKKTGEV